VARKCLTDGADGKAWLTDRCSICASEELYRRVADTSKLKVKFGRCEKDEERLYRLDKIATVGLHCIGGGCQDGEIVELGPDPEDSGRSHA